MKRLTLTAHGGFVEEELTVRSATIEAGGVLVIHEVPEDGPERVRMIAPGFWVEAVAEELR